MDDKKAKKPEDKKLDAQDFPGVQPDIAGGGKVDPKMVEDETKELNNNPRNDYK